MLCRFPTELDDVVVSTKGGRCVCLRCFTRETGTTRTMPAALRRAVTALVAETSIA
jgi:recombinational DNA repair protein (RecF pathway)